MVARDKLGRPFGAGDFIAYGHALGRCAGLRIGKVLAIKRFEPSPYNGPNAREPLWRISVIGVDDDWSSRPPELCKKGTLQFPNRCLRLDPADVPVGYHELYDEAGL
jgi:hypothetical protein